MPMAFGQRQTPVSDNRGPVTNMFLPCSVGLPMRWYFRPLHPMGKARIALSPIPRDDTDETSRIAQTSELMTAQMMVPAAATASESKSEDQNRLDLCSKRNH